MDETRWTRVHLGPRASVAKLAQGLVVHLHQTCTTLVWLDWFWHLVRLHDEDFDTASNYLRLMIRSFSKFLNMDEPRWTRVHLGPRESVAKLAQDLVVHLHQTCTSLVWLDWFWQTCTTLVLLI